jgi:DNA-binding transcriptional ArsR family regulator
MDKPFEKLANLDRLIHDPSRLAILTALQYVQSADFLFLQQVTGMTPGNLSQHLAKLEEGSLLEIEKQFVGKKPHTRIRLSSEGRNAIKHHWKKLEALRKGAEHWKPD